MNEIKGALKKKKKHAGLDHIHLVNVVNYLYDVIIEKQPEVVTLDDSDVVSAIGPAVKMRSKYINHT